LLIPLADRRKVTKEQLRLRLEVRPPSSALPSTGLYAQDDPAHTYAVSQIIGDLSGSLPSDLPSPPPSRASTSAINHKRKAADVRPAGEPSLSKRPRLHESASLAVLAADAADAHLPTRRKDGPDHSSSSADNVPGPSTLPPPVAFQPIRRPRRGATKEEMKLRAEKYAFQGRMLKSSGDDRHFASYPKGDKHYKPLIDPPEQGSKYHTHSAVIARLESLDALVTLAYGIWCGPQRNYEHDYISWESFRDYIKHCKGKWKAEDRSSGERERALYGLMSVLFIAIAETMPLTVALQLHGRVVHLRAAARGCYE
jgi:hypothetical protein